MLNSLRYAKALEEVGVPRKQAEAHINILTEMVESHLATKHDLKELEYRIIFRLGALVVAGNAATVALLTLIMKFSA